MNTASRRGARARIHYRIIASEPGAHRFSVSLRIDNPMRAQTLSLPVWIPGSYLVREFARHVEDIAARDASGRMLRLTKTDKNRWLCANDGEGAIEIGYFVYAWDLSVRTAYLDAERGFFNGTSTFLRVDGREHEPCSVEILPPDDPRLANWRCATALSPAAARAVDRRGFGRYLAQDYDELIDHPVEMSDFVEGQFRAGHCVHRVVISGRVDVDMPRLCRDLKAVCDRQIRLFEPQSARAPMNEYVFMTAAVGEGYGGLEHRASTALLCARDELPSPEMGGIRDGYRQFLGLASHEYFHTWNVKRIKPAAFEPYRLDMENFSELLWIFEGFTAYYDDLMLARAGLMTPLEYMNALQKTIRGVLAGPGHQRQSVAESSFDTWIKFYRPDENSPNSIVNYYTKGSLVALCLDLSLRAATKGRRSLDDVMRLMWTRHGRDFFARRSARTDPAQQLGLGEQEFPDLLREATGRDMKREIRAWAHGTGELPLKDLLAHAGVGLTLVRDGDARSSLGARVAVRPQGLALTNVYRGCAAERALLAAGDVIVAVDGLRCDDRAMNRILNRRRAGEVVRIHAFRRDELIETELVLDASAPVVKLDAGKGNAFRKDWLGA